MVESISSAPDRQLGTRVTAMNGMARTALRSLQGKDF